MCVCVVVCVFTGSVAQPYLLSPLTFQMSTVLSRVRVSGALLDLAAGLFTSEPRSVLWIPKLHKHLQGIKKCAHWK